MSWSAYRQAGLLIGDVLLLGFILGLKPLVPLCLGTVNGLTIFLVVFLYSSLKLVE